MNKVSTSLSTKYKIYDFTLKFLGSDFKNLYFSVRKIIFLNYPNIRDNNMLVTIWRIENNLKLTTTKKNLS